MPRVRPVSFAIRPLDRGLNYSQSPNVIESNESPRLDNVRINKGFVASRNGFEHKIKGVADTILWIDFVYSTTQTQIVAFGSKGIYVERDGKLVPMKVFNQNGVDLGDNPFDIDPLASVISVESGFGQYNFQGANAGQLYPNSDTFDTITFFSTGDSAGIYAMVFGVNGAEAERITGEVAPSLARGISVFADRLFIGGDENDNARISWSAPGLISNWTADDGAGSMILGDTPDWIQTIRRLGDYLIVYKERSIYIGRRTNRFDPPIVFEPAPGQGIGLAAPNSVGDLGEEHIFLGWDNVYMFSLNRIEAIGDNIRDSLFYGAGAILPEYVENCTGVIAEEFAEYWLFVPTGGWPAGIGDDGGVQNLVENPLMAVSEEYDEGDVLDFDDVEGVTGTGKYAVGNLGSDAILIEESNSISIEIDAPEQETYSMQLWCDVEDEAEVHIDGMTFELEQTDGSFGLTTRSFSLDAGPHTVEIEAVAGSVTVDAIHIVPFSDVDDRYIAGPEGFQYIGYIGSENEPVQIPLIATEIGPWLPDTVWVFNYKDNAWTRWRMPVTGFGYDSVEPIFTVANLEGTIAEQTWRFGDKAVTAFAPTNLFAQIDGQIYETNIDMDRDYIGVLPTEYSVFWESKDIDMDRPDIDKTVTKVIFYHAIDHPQKNAVISVSTDSGATWEDRPVVIMPGTLETVANFIVTGNQIRAKIRVERAPLEVYGFGMRIVPRGEHHVYA